MLTHVEFRSDRFPAVAGEDKLVNPGRWGRRLADFVREGLVRKGFEAREPLAEDWGYMLPVSTVPFHMWVGCGNYEGYPDAFLCFIEPHKPFVRKFLKKIDTRERVTALQRALDNILADDAGIRSKRWFTYEDFNKRYL